MSMLGEEGERDPSGEQLRRNTQDDERAASAQVLDQQHLVARLVEDQLVDDVLRQQQPIATRTQSLLLSPLVVSEGVFVGKWKEKGGPVE